MPVNVGWRDRTVKKCDYCHTAIPHRSSGQSEKAYLAIQFCSSACRSAGIIETGVRKKERPKIQCRRCADTIPMEDWPPSALLKRKYCGPNGCLKYAKSGVVLSEYRTVGKDGYVTVWHRGEWMREHRAIAEWVLGRPLRKGEVVHHVNGDKTDNRFSNLLICQDSYHRWLHWEMSNRYMREHFQRRSDR